VMNSRRRICPPRDRFDGSAMKATTLRFSRM
jgi:hypothetical protein